jgi:hypothetical protein
MKRLLFLLAISGFAEFAEVPEGVELLRCELRKVGAETRVHGEVAHDRKTVELQLYPPAGAQVYGFELKVDGQFVPGTAVPLAAWTWGWLEIQVLGELRWAPTHYELTLHGTTEFRLRYREADGPVDGLVTARQCSAVLGGLIDYQNLELDPPEGRFSWQLPRAPDAKARLQHKLALDHGPLLRWLRQWRLPELSVPLEALDGQLQDAKLRLHAGYLCCPGGRAARRRPGFSSRFLEDNAPDLLANAISAEAAGDAKSALAGFAEASEALPQNPAVLWLRASFLARQGKHDAARELFLEAAGWASTRDTVVILNDLAMFASEQLSLPELALPLEADLRVVICCLEREKTIALEIELPDGSVLAPEGGLLVEQLIRNAEPGEYIIRVRAAKSNWEAHTPVASVTTNYGRHNA